MAHPVSGARAQWSCAIATAGFVLLAAACGDDAEIMPSAGNPTPMPTSADSATVATGDSATEAVGNQGGPSSVPPLPEPTPAPGSGASDSGSGADSGGLGSGSSGAGGAVRPAAGRDAGAVDTSRPDRVVGSGTPASCTSEAVVAAVAAGGIITFDCGPDPVTIRMTATAKVVNAASPVVVLDGGGLVTLSGQEARRILYQNTCDQAQGWTTPHCDNQDHPRLTVQNITFADGNASGQGPDTGGGGGGAIFARGGTLTVINAGFARNRCDETGPDVGGAAIRVFDQHEDRPVRVVESSFTGGACSNGGALSSIGVSWEIVDSELTGNRATGVGANPARAGTPGGGSGGAIYTDGNRFTLSLTRTRIEGNHANAGGGAVFFVSNDRTGTMRIEGSTLRDNPSDDFETAGLPGIFFLGASAPVVVGSSLD